jgi:hypothetical protein
MTDDAADRAQALRELRDDRARTEVLLAAIDPAALATGGLGGGTWSPADLLGHLESWEEHALDAIAAWGRGEPPPISLALETLGTDEVNRRAVDAKADRTPAVAAVAAASTLETLLAALASFDEATWSAPPEAGDERSRGQHIGAILGGERGLFRHDPDHWHDLEAFARDHPAP